MNKKLLYILLHFLSAVLADWTTIEHDFNMCGLDVPSEYTAIHVNDDGNTYSTSLLVRGIDTLNSDTTQATYNVTMWGCTYDCDFNFVVKLNKVDGSVSITTDSKAQNYVCGGSKYTQNLIPTPKVTYTGATPNEDHVFPPELTAKYCSLGIHPDSPNWPIKPSNEVHTCIDRLTGREDGTYAASLQFGVGSTFPTDKLSQAIGVATFHLADSANKAFNHWERHHRGFHDALDDLSTKMTTQNLKELAPPPPPEKKLSWLGLLIAPVVALIIVAAVPLGGSLLAAAGAGIGEALTFTEISTGIAEVAARVVTLTDIIKLMNEEDPEKKTAIDNKNNLVNSQDGQNAEKLYSQYLSVRNEPSCQTQSAQCAEDTLNAIGQVYNSTKNPNVGQILAALSKKDGNKKKRGVRGKYERRDAAVDNLGFFTANLVGAYFLPNVLSNVHDSLYTGGKSYPDISSYLAGASENLLYHFTDTVYNNMFAANKSILNSFVKSQGVSYDKLVDSDDDLYNDIKSRTYNQMSASIISSTLKNYKVVICDPKPSFCGQPCGDDNGHTFCPTIGTDNCIIAASPGQISELKSLRDTSDICSNKDTGWDITHDANCDISPFQCQ